jgi:hypothetical protein
MKRKKRLLGASSGRWLEMLLVDGVVFCRGSELPRMVCRRKKFGLERPEKRKPFDGVHFPMLITMTRMHDNSFDFTLVEE